MRYFFIGRRRLLGPVPRYRRTSAPLPTASDFDSDLLLGSAPGFVSGLVPGFVSGLVPGLVPGFASGLVSPLSLAPEAVVASGFAAGFAPLFLQPSASHPLPFNCNAAALRIFPPVWLPDAGRTSSTGSLRARMHPF